jgi:hypothetical protein
MYRMPGGDCYPALLQTTPASPTNTYICQEPWITYFITAITIVGGIICLYKYCRKMTLLKGYRYRRACEMYLFLSCNNYYVPLKLRNTSGLSHMFSLNKSIHAQQITISKQILWDLLHIDWADLTVKLNGITVMLPHEVTIPLLDKIRVRRMLCEPDLVLHLMLKSGNNWTSLPLIKERTDPTDQQQTTLINV